MKKLLIPIFVYVVISIVSCKTEENNGYNCNNGNCTAVFENPQYLTLVDCQSICADQTPPIITLNGAATVNIFIGDNYIDAGAIAYDNFNGDLTTYIVTTNNVNTTYKCSYTVNYSVTDIAGNIGTASRIVNVNNTVDYLDGSFNATDDYNSDGTIDFAWTENISSSSSVNNQIKFLKFAYYTGGTLTANISGSTVSYPGSQILYCGVPPQNRTFTITSGTISDTTITIHYHQVDTDGDIFDGVDVYSKQ